ncbi:MAG: VanW family protein [Gaiellaceae bacterium]
MLELAVRRPRRISRLRRSAPFLLGLAGLAALVAALLAGRALLHRGEAMPGVQILGTDLGGIDAAQTGPLVRTLTARRLAEPVTLTVGSGQTRIAPRVLFTLDRSATTAAVLAAGRGSLAGRARSLLSPLTRPTEVAPVLVVRPAAARRLRALLDRFGTPPVSATVVMRGTNPVVRPSRAGTTADLDALLAALASRVAAGAGSVPVGFEPAAPAVRDRAAEAAAEEARIIVTAPVALTYEGQPVGTLTQERLARLLRFRARDGRLLALFAESRLARVLDPAVAPWKERAVNARFAVDGSRATVVPSQLGTGLDADAAVVAVTTAAHAHGERTAALRLEPVPAALTTEEARGLGIRERVSSFTTDMGPSSSNRIHNVHLMADYIDGTIVRPGESFSFNGSVGPRTPGRGFLEGQMIVGSLLLPSIGGGVCQTATTLFNNAFELGLPVVERHNHSFYISHYPMGRDATVSWGGPDFKFRNDMEHALLIKASYTSSTLTFSFYGTDEGRRVTASTGPQVNWKAPRLTYALDPAAPRGSVRYERGSHQQGFDVTVFRTVTKAGKTLRKDSFKSAYIPVGDTVVYGPGQSIPGSYFVIPTT